MVRTFWNPNAFHPPVSPPFPSRRCPPAAQARTGPSPAARSTEPLLTASWGWCPTPARREWQWAPPWRPRLPPLSALCTHWYSKPPGAGPADGPKEPAASARRGPAPRPLQNRSPRPRPSRPPQPQPPPPPWLPPCAAARDRWARVKGHSKLRPARPFVAAHPGSHRGDWAAGAMRLELHSLSSRPPHPPASAVTPQTSDTCQAGEFEQSRGWFGPGWARPGVKPQASPRCPSALGGLLECGLSLWSSLREQTPRSRRQGRCWGPDERTNAILSCCSTSALPSCGVTKLTQN